MIQRRNAPTKAPRRLTLLRDETRQSADTFRDLRSRLAYYDHFTVHHGVPSAPRQVRSPRGRPTAADRRAASPLECQRQTQRILDEARRALSRAERHLVELSLVATEPHNREDVSLWRRVMQARVLLEEAFDVLPLRVVPLTAERVG